MGDRHLPYTDYLENAQFQVKRACSECVPLLVSVITVITFTSKMHKNFSKPSNIIILYTNQRNVPPSAESCRAKVRMADTCIHLNFSTVRWSLRALYRILVYILGLAAMQFNTETELPKAA